MAGTAIIFLLWWVDDIESEWLHFQALSLTEDSDIPNAISFCLTAQRVNSQIEYADVNKASQQNRTPPGFDSVAYRTQLEIDSDGKDNLMSHKNLSESFIVETSMCMSLRFLRSLSG